MKSIYKYAASGLLILSACSSPAKKQHSDRGQTINRLENNSADAVTDPENHINSGNMTDSTNTDTTGNN